MSKFVLAKVAEAQSQPGKQLYTNLVMNVVDFLFTRFNKIQQSFTKTVEI